jgi:predicted metal-dependent hydrolase
MSLAAARVRVAEARATGGEALAEALLDLAELEPLLPHRSAIVRAPLEETASLLDRLGRPALEGRALLRLAHIKLVENDLEGVEQLVGRAQQRLDGDVDRRLEGESLLARAKIRRHDFTAAEAVLVAIGEQAPDDEPATTAARRAAIAVALAWVELAVEQQQYAEAGTRLETLAAALAAAPDDELIEADFTCRQLRAAVALAQDNMQTASAVLREAVVIAKRVGSIQDELETRVALAGALVQRGDPVAWDEAEKHLQITRDAALEHNLDGMRMAALVGQAGLMAQKGQTQAALDRCLEIAQAAVEKQDLTRYVAAVSLMSGIYERKGDLASAYRTFAEAHASLREKLGDQAKDLIRPPMSAFAARIGHDKFSEIAEAVNKAAHARQTFRRRS